MKNMHGNNYLNMFVLISIVASIYSDGINAASFFGRKRSGVEAKIEQGMNRLVEQMHKVQAVFAQAIVDVMKKDRDNRPIIANYNKNWATIFGESELNKNIDSLINLIDQVDTASMLPVLMASDEKLEKLLLELFDANNRSSLGQRLNYFVGSGDKPEDSFAMQWSKRVLGYVERLNELSNHIIQKINALKQMQGTMQTVGRAERYVASLSSQPKESKSLSLVEGKAGLAQQTIQTTLYFEASDLIRQLAAAINNFRKNSLQLYNHEPLTFTPIDSLVDNLQTVLDEGATAPTKRELSQLFDLKVIVPLGCIIVSLGVIKKAIDLEVPLYSWLKLRYSRFVETPLKLANVGDIYQQLGFSGAEGKSATWQEVKEVIAMQYAAKVGQRYESREKASLWFWIVTALFYTPYDKLFFDAYLQGEEELSKVRSTLNIDMQEFKKLEDAVTAADERIRAFKSRYLD